MFHFFSDPNNAYLTFVILLFSNLLLLFPALILLKQHFAKKKDSNNNLSLEVRQLQNNRTIIIILSGFLLIMALFQARYIRSAILKINDLNVSLEQGDGAAKNYRSIRDRKKIFGNETGKFFLIDLEETKYHQILTFKGGWYTFDDDDRNYQAAIGELAKNISAYDGFYTYRIFIRGKADSVADKTFHGIYDPAYHFDTCHYFKDISPGQTGTRFDIKPILLSFPRGIHNSNLPALRSAFFASQLRTSGSNFQNIYLLEGKVEQIRDPQQRNIIMLLYVEDGPLSIFKGADIKESLIFLLLFLFFMYVIIRQLRENRKILDRVNKRRLLLLRRQELLSNVAK
ncbi:hypothetical protein [Mucilaginibacter sp.]|uniref:hypothetical protein n=1 Tax=Mucilaginibacter sp. TaxID=1882438 RepID=UPI0025D8EE3C|nr:hypothetical protein [Mucilaginibacter sp.]